MVNSNLFYASELDQDRISCSGSHFTLLPVWDALFCQPSPVLSFAAIPPSPGGGWGRLQGFMPDLFYLPTQASIPLSRGNAP